MPRASSTVTKNDTATLPLSVLLFNAAMTQELSLSDFAKKIGIGPLSLRQFISGQTQRPRGKTLDMLADALGISVDDARDHLGLKPTAAPAFADWLRSLMNGSFSRARLTRETRISDGALRNYLSGQTLPDTDQAQRLALALNIPSLDVAKIIVADQTVREGGQVAPAPVAPPTPAEEPTPAPAPEPLPTPPSPPVFMEVPPISLAVQSESAPPEPAPAPAPARVSQVTLPVADEERLLHLWRQMHPQGRRATLIYIAGLLAEG